MKGIMCL